MRVNSAPRRGMRRCGNSARWVSACQGSRLAKEQSLTGLVYHESPRAMRIDLVCAKKVVLLDLHREAAQANDDMAKQALGHFREDRRRRRSPPPVAIALPPERKRVAGRGSSEGSPTSLLREDPRVCVEPVCPPSLGGSAILAGVDVLTERFVPHGELCLLQFQVSSASVDPQSPQSPQDPGSSSSPGAMSDDLRARKWRLAQDAWRHFRRALRLAKVHQRKQVRGYSQHTQRDLAPSRRCMNECGF